MQLADDLPAARKQAARRPSVEQIRKEAQPITGCGRLVVGDSPGALRPVDRLQPFSVAIQATVTRHPSGLNSQSAGLRERGGGKKAEEKEQDD